MARQSSRPRGRGRRRLAPAAQAGYARLVRRAAVLALVLASSSVAHADPSELVGQRAPEIRARALDTDGEVRLESYRGRVVLLAFVATWCRACRSMAPELEALRAAHPESLEVIALSHEARDRLRAYTAGTPRSYPTVQCTGRTARRYHATGLPTIVIVDRAGVVRAAYQGATPDVVRAVRRDVSSLVGAR